MLLNKKKNKALSVMYLLIFLSKNFKAAWEVTRKKLLMLFGTEQTIPPTSVLTLIMYLLIFLGKNFKATWEVTRKKLIILFGTKQTTPPTRVLTLII